MSVQEVEDHVQPLPPPLPKKWFRFHHICTHINELFDQLQVNQTYMEMKDYLQTRVVQEFMSRKNWEVPPDIPELNHPLNNYVTHIIHHWFALIDCRHLPTLHLYKLWPYINRLARVADPAANLAIHRIDLVNAFWKVREMVRMFADAERFSKTHWAMALHWMKRSDLPQEQRLDKARPHIDEVLAKTGQVPGWWPQQQGLGEALAVPMTQPLPPANPVQILNGLIADVNELCVRLENIDQFVELRACMRHQKIGEYLVNAMDLDIPPDEPDPNAPIHENARHIRDCIDWFLDTTHTSGIDLIQEAAELQSKVDRAMDYWFVRGSDNALRLAPIRPLFTVAFWQIEQVYRNLMDGENLAVGQWVRTL